MAATAHCSVSYTHLPLGKRLAEDLGLEVLVGNDMLFTTYGFYARQEGDCGDTVAVLYFPKNACPGSGAVVDGQLLRGCLLYTSGCR